MLPTRKRELVVGLVLSLFLIISLFLPSYRMGPASALLGHECASTAFSMPLDGTFTWLDLIYTGFTFGNVLLVVLLISLLFGLRIYRWVVLLMFASILNIGYFWWRDVTADEHDLMFGFYLWAAVHILTLMCFYRFRIRRPASNS